MKVLNNKGYLLVEVIVSSVISIMMIYTVARITIHLRGSESELNRQIVYEEQENLIIKEIKDGLGGEEIVEVDYSLEEGRLDLFLLDGKIMRIWFDLINNKFFYGELGEVSCLGESCYKDIYVSLALDDNLEVAKFSIDVEAVSDSSYYKNILVFYLRMENSRFVHDWDLKLVLPYGF